MKRCILTLISFLFCCVNIHIMAQQNDSISAEKDWRNFYSRGERIYWQHIFEINKSRSDIVYHFASADWKGKMSITWQEMNDSTLNGVLYRKLDYKQYEIAYDSSPIYIRSGICRYDVRIDVKEGRYRVTIMNIRFDTASFSNTLDNVVMGSLVNNYYKEEKGVWLDFEDTLYKSNGNLRGYVLPKLVPMLDNMWLDEYSYKESETIIISNEW